MKILIIHSLFHPFHGIDFVEGGIENHTALLYLSLIKQGHIVDIYSSKESTFKNAIKSDNLAKVNLPGRYSISYYFNNLPDVNNYDIVINNSDYSIIEKLSKLNVKCKLFHVLHDFLYGPQSVNISDSMSKNNKVIFIAVSQYVSMIYKKNGIKTQVLLATSLGNYIPENTCSIKDKTITVAARLNHELYLNELIEAVGINFKDYNLNIYGEYQTHKSEKSAVEKIKKSVSTYKNINLNPSISKKKLYEVFNSSEIVANLACFHSFGFSAFEALCLGNKLLYVTKSHDNTDNCTTGIDSFAFNSNLALRLNLFNKRYKQRVSLFVDGIQQLLDRDITNEESNIKVFEDSFNNNVKSIFIEN